MKAKTKTEATEQVATPTQEQKPAVLKVKPGQQYRGNRKAWYEVLTAHDGKPVAEFLKATADKPPALTRAGTPEAPSGWLRFFVRTGTASVTQ